MIRDHASYLVEVFEDYPKVLKRLRKLLKGKRYDTLVATGLSGALVILPLAQSLHKHALVVRKPEVNTHSWRDCEGTLGKRWIFVDDLIKTGETLRLVKRAIEQRIKEYNPKFKTTFAGAVLYFNDKFVAPKETDK